MNRDELENDLQTAEVAGTVVGQTANAIADSNAIPGASDTLKKVGFWTGLGASLASMLAGLFGRKSR